MSNRCFVEGEYRVEASVLDELGLDRQAALELKLKASLHQNSAAGEAEGKNQVQRRWTGVSDPHEPQRLKPLRFSILFRSAGSAAPPKI